MPVSLRVDGFERTRLELRVDRVDEQVLGPAEAMRAVGSELTGSFEVQGPIVLVHARLPAAELPGAARSGGGPSPTMEAGA